MKQFLAVEKLGGGSSKEGWYRLIFCARDWDEAEEWVWTYMNTGGSKTKLCGECT